MDTNNYNNQRQQNLGYKYITCPRCQGTGMTLIIKYNMFLNIAL